MPLAARCGQPCRWSPPGSPAPQPERRGVARPRGCARLVFQYRDDYFRLLPANARSTLTLGKKWLRAYLCPYLNSLFKLLFNCLLINVKDRGSQAALPGAPCPRVSVWRGARRLPWSSSVRPFPSGQVLPSADATPAEVSSRCPQRCTALRAAEGGPPFTVWQGDPGAAAEGGKPDTFSYSVLLSIHYAITAHICQFYFYPFFFT